MTGSAGQVERLACLGLRGGNHSAQYAARLPGLTAWVSCNPLWPSRRGGDLYYLSACSLGSIARVVLFCRATTQEWSYLQDFMPEPKEVSDLPLGMIPGTEYHQTAARLSPGDLLILYTDGINEAENESGDQLGLECLLSMARSLPVSSAAAAGEALMAAVVRFRGSAPAKDDATVVALRCEGAA